MRRAVSVLAATCMLAGATVLAFFSGGYFAGPQLAAGVAAWVLVLALAVTAPAPLPRSAAGRLAAGGLALLTAWTGASIAWAPMGGPAVQDLDRLLLYLGALLLAVGTLRTRRALRAVEPALAAGATVVIGYGLAGRLLPGVVHLAHSRSAGGRLEQPITYWNGEGALAAVGFVLCVRLAGDRSRAPAVRVLAAAAAVPLATGVYLSYSRGALAAALIGVVVLLALAPTRAQLGAAVALVAAGVLAAVVAAVLPGVASLAGHRPGRDGAIALAALAVLSTAAAAWTARDARRGGEDRLLARARRLGTVAALVAVAGAAGLIIGGLGERPSPSELATGASPARLTSSSSNRSEYWRVAFDALQAHPLAGLGAGGFRVEWLKRRTIRETVHDAHSLEIGTAAELGLVGLLALGLFLAGAVLSARTALSRHPAAAAGLAAAALTWLLHASIDWDWQLPAVSLPAVVLAGALIALAEAPASAPQSSSAIRGASRLKIHTASTHTPT